MNPIVKFSSQMSINSSSGPIFGGSSKGGSIRTIPSNFRKLTATADKAKTLSVPHPREV